MLTGLAIRAEKYIKMKVPELFKDKDLALIYKFRDLPEPEKTEIFDEAQKIVENIITTLPKAIIGTEGFSNEDKQKAIEFFMGPLNQTEAQALKDGSRFSKFYDLAIVSAVIEIMKEYEKGKSNVPEAISD
jgi:hypothetical protein